MAKKAASEEKPNPKKSSPKKLKSEPTLYAPTTEQAKAIKAGRAFCERCGNTYTWDISCGCPKQVGL